MRASAVLSVFAASAFWLEGGAQRPPQPPPRGATPPQRDEIPLGFRVDNIHWTRDGRLWAVDQAGQSWKAVKIDPRTLEVHEAVTRADTPELGAGTAVAEVGDTLWVGSYRGDRIAIIPAP